MHCGANKDALWQCTAQNGSTFKVEFVMKGARHDTASKLHNTNSFMMRSASGAGAVQRPLESLWLKLYKGFQQDLSRKPAESRTREVSHLTMTSGDRIAAAQYQK